jgi:hypothetical protein
MGQDLATALCGGFNSLYFYLYALRPSEAPRRRIGAGALALANAGALVESLFLLALYLSLHCEPPNQSALYAAGPWLFARALPFLGTAFVTLLIFRSHRQGTAKG